MYERHLNVIKTHALSELNVSSMYTNMKLVANTEGANEVLNLFMLRVILPIVLTWTLLICLFIFFII